MYNREMNNNWRKCEKRKYLADWTMRVDALVVVEGVMAYGVVAGSKEGCGAVGLDKLAPDDCEARFSERTGMEAYI